MPKDVEIRALCSAELDAYRHHLLRLDARSRHARFGWAMDDSGINAHCLRLASQPTTVIGALVDGAIRGGLELWPDGSATRAEMVLSVEDECRRQGLATALIECALAEGRRQGLAALEIDIDDANPAMMELVAKFSGKRVGVDEGARASIAIPRAA
jgi:GNAT superfamily N-acetyltransferase